MKQFLKTTLASMLGFFLSIILLIVLFIFLAAGIIFFAGSSKPVSINSGSVLEISLDQPIPERTSGNPFKGFDFGSFEQHRPIGLNDILENIRKAKNDEKIKGIYLDLSTVRAGFGTIEEIRSALLDFKTSGKFIYAYSEAYSQGAYYLASASDKIFLNPQGMLDFRGLSSEIMFFRGSLQKLEIDMQVIRHGKFKSAVEPYILDKMSDENRKQVSGFLQATWDHLLEGISKARGVDIPALKRLADNMAVRTPGEALKNKMIDGITFKDEVLSGLKRKLGIKESEDISFVTLNKYLRVPETSKNSTYRRDKIALIYAAGTILSGEGDDESIGSEKLSETIRKASKDKAVRAIVLRVNSPGGSALASDVIWREVALARREKPVVVSMGDVAASGGYYISCAASSIIAEPTTITGSIGVFGVVPNIRELLKNKLGITVDTVKTGRMADMGSLSRPLSPDEKNILQHYVEMTYDTFLTRVAEGRKMKKEDVDSIGQGRVWSARDAKNNGLVDSLGGISDAIALAAKMANTSSYRIVSLPEEKEFLRQLLDFADNMETSVLQSKLGEVFRYYHSAESLRDIKGIQARMPYDISVY